MLLDSVLSERLKEQKYTPGNLIINKFNCNNKRKIKRLLTSDVPHRRHAR